MMAGRMAETVGRRPNAAEVMPNGVMAELRKLYYDTASAASPASMAALRIMAPASHILFGSDYPFVKAAAGIEELQHTQMSDAEREAIDRGNAMALAAAPEGLNGAIIRPPKSPCGCEGDDNDPDGEAGEGVHRAPDAEQRTMRLIWHDPSRNSGRHSSCGSSGTRSPQPGPAGRARQADPHHERGTTRSTAARRAGRRSSTIVVRIAAPRFISLGRGRRHPLRLPRLEVRLLRPVRGAARGGSGVRPQGEDRHLSDARISRPDLRLFRATASRRPFPHFPTARRRA